MEIRNFVFGLFFLLSGTPEIDVRYLALETLTDDINTRFYDEIAPCITADGETLYFTRVGYPEYEKTLIENGQNLWEAYDQNFYERHLSSIYSIIAGEKVNNPVSSGFNQDIWIARTVNFEFDKLEHPGYPINNALPNSVSTINAQNNELILINEFVEGGGMQKGFSKIKRDQGGNWEFPQAINISNYHNSGPDVNVTLSTDGQTMIIALERKDSYGQSDLYVSFQNPDQSWSTPKNLGRSVNSAFREATPHLSEDMNTLYFSSNRGRKGSDIYVQTRLDDSWEKWSAPKRFSAPINSRADDSHPYFNEATGYLYFTSKRNGSSDIFRVQVERPKPKGHTLKLNIINTETKENMEVDALINKEHYTDVLKAYDGKFRLNLTEKETCLITIKKEGFAPLEKEISLKNAKKVKPGLYHLVLELMPINEDSSLISNIEEIPSPVEEHAKPIINQDTNINSKPKEKPIETFTLDAIQFQKSQAVVLSKSYPTLDKLTHFLNKNQDVHIRIIGHTDDVGDKQALQKLSKERAEAIKAFLVVKKGVNPDRIKTVGHGGDKPLNDNSSEKLRAQNRRVEVEVFSNRNISFGLQEN